MKINANGAILAGNVQMSQELLKVRLPRTEMNGLIATTLIRNNLYNREGWLEYFLNILDDVRLAFVHVEFVGVRSVKVFVAEAALEPRSGGVRPVVTAELISSDKAGPAALVGAGEWPRPGVVTKVSLQVVPLCEGLELIKINSFLLMMSFQLTFPQFST